MKKIMIAGLVGIVFFGLATTAFAAKGIVKNGGSGGTGRILVTESDADSAVQPGNDIEFSEDIASRSITEGDYVNFDIQAAEMVSPDRSATGVTVLVAVNITKISTGTVIETAQSGNLTISANQAVTIRNGGSQKGNITVSGGKLFVTGQSAIGGNLRITAGGSFILCDGQSTVSGTNFEGAGGGSSTYLQISACRVNGRFNSSGISTVVLSGNTVNGNITSEGDGNVTITNNTINGSLTVSGVTGSCDTSGNTVSGNTTLDPLCTGISPEGGS